MLAQLHHTEMQPVRQPEPGLPDAWRGELNRLRVIALRCRVAAQTDLFRACALISSTDRADADIHAQALFKCLREALGRQGVFFQPGTAEVSFDEAWLMRAVIAAAQDDGDSLTFLIRSRVRFNHQRQMAFLIKGITRRTSHF